MPCLWVTGPLSDVSSFSCPVKICLFSQPDKARSSVASPSTPSSLQTWFRMCASWRASRGTRKHCRGVDMRQMELNNAGDSQASAGLQCWPGFKSLRLANWDREGASCNSAIDGFKGAPWSWACPALPWGPPVPGAPGAVHQNRWGSRTPALDRC